MATIADTRESHTQVNTFPFQCTKSNALNGLNEIGCLQILICHVFKPKETVIIVIRVNQMNKILTRTISFRFM